MGEIRNLTRNGETFYPLTHIDGVLDRTGEKLIINDIFDISEYNATGDPLVSQEYSNLSSALSGIPLVKQKPGMTIRFIESTNHTYLQYRLLTPSWSTNTDDWISMNIDDEPITGSNNLVTSGGVYEELDGIQQQIDGKLLDYTYESGLIDSRDGLRKTPSVNFATSFIEVSGFEKINYSRLATNGISNYAGMAFYDANNEYISGQRWIVNSEETKYVNTELDVPSNAVYARFTVSSTLPIEDFYVKNSGILDRIKHLSEIDLEPTAGSVKPVQSGGIAEYYGAYEENSEWVRLIADSQGKIIVGIRNNGEIEWMSGIPTPVKEYINKKIDDMSLDEYDDIVNFLVNLLGGETLETLLNNKVDKEEGKGLINEEFSSSADVINESSYLSVTTDSDGRIIEAVAEDGTKIVFVNFKAESIQAESIQANSVQAESIQAGGHVFNNQEDDDIISALIDENGKVLSYRKKNGVSVELIGMETEQVKARNAKVEEADISRVTIGGGAANLDELTLSEEGMTEFQQALRDGGFEPGGKGDWSGYLSGDGEKPLHLPEPRCAMLNIITDVDLTKLSKMGYTYDRTVPTPISGVNCELPTLVEFYDMQGNYFKKWTEMSGQGRSSMRYPKKNISLDFFDIEYGGDAFAFKFGDWVPQDSYHLKAYYTDFFRGVALGVYKLAMDIEDSKPYNKNRIWKKALLASYNLGNSTNNMDSINNIDFQAGSEARCMPDGFPVIVYRNGEFYGIFSWQIKKSRDNYMMKKNNPLHIHLDADHINNSTLFGGTIDWTEFEVRNPKSLVYAPNVFSEWSDSVTYGYGSIVRNAAWTKVYRSMGVGNTGNSLDDENWWIQVGSSCFKYDSDITNGEIAGTDNSTFYDGDWSQGIYAIGRIVRHGDNYFINQVDGNDKEPTLSNNTADSPDYKNKSGCGWINCTTSVAVKNSIIALSNRIAEIDAAATDEEKKLLLNTYFDYDNLIDYEIVQMVTGSYDSFNSNWQWTTWDGVKWFVNEYDKDCSYGGISYGTITMPPALTGPSGVDFKLDSTWTSGLYAYKYIGPLKFIEAFYVQDRIDRYCELRSSGIISVDNMFKKISDFVSRVGCDNYKKEYKKWTNCECNRDLVLRSGWKLHPYNTMDEYRNFVGYNAETVYNEGDICIDSYFAVEATETVSGVKPVQTGGHRDNIFRLRKWIEDRISMIDAAYEYSE